MKPTSEQRSAIETQDCAVIVEAGAGTGKTWVLVQRFMYLLENNPSWSIDSIIAITFTEKAAREMRTRIRQEVEKKARDNPAEEKWQEHRRMLDRMQVSTIHSICARILRENAIAAKIDPQFEVLDEQEADLLKQEAIRETIADLNEENSPGFELLLNLQVRDLREQMESLLAKRGTVIQIFKNLPSPEYLLDNWRVGFEEMKAEIWQEQTRLNPDLEMTVRSLIDIEIHDPGDKLARSVNITQDGCRAFENDDLTRAINCWLEIKLVGGKQANWGGKEILAELKSDLKTLRTVAQEFEKVGGHQEIGPSDEAAANDIMLWGILWQKLDDTYDRLKSKRQVLDFDDLELLTDKLLQEEQPNDRMQDYLSEINHLMVDEFQDTNAIQKRIVYALASPDKSGKLFIVGDAKQSIYRFRQAQVSIFTEALKEISEKWGKSSLSLSESFRSHQSLLNALNDLFNSLLEPMGETHQPFEARPDPLSTSRLAPSASTSSEAPVEMLVLPERDADDLKISAEDARIWEAKWIAVRIHGLKEEKFPVWDKNKVDYRPFEYGDAAVLFRATTVFPIYEAEFKAAGLPYMTVSGRGYYDRQEIRDLVSLLSAVNNPGDDLSLASVLRSPLFNLNDETLYQLRWHNDNGNIPEDPIPLARSLSNPPETGQNEQVKNAAVVIQELWSIAGLVDVWQLLRTAIDRTGYEAALAMNDGQFGRQRRNVQKFLELARDRGGVSVSDFLIRIHDLQTREAREGEASGTELESGAVQMMSIHAAKGLEFPVVFVADLGRKKRSGFSSPYMLNDPDFGIMCKRRDEEGDWEKPAGYCWGDWLNDRMEEAECKRLLYVACTRAADLLVLSGQIDNRESWLSDVINGWRISLNSDEERMIPFEGYKVKFYQPIERPEESQKIHESPPHSPGIDVTPELAQSIAQTKTEKHISISRIEELLLDDEEKYPSFRPVIRSSQRSTSAPYVPGFILGNIVHKALADWDCLALSERELIEKLEFLARREGIRSQKAIDNAVRTCGRMLEHLKDNHLYEEINQSQDKYHEIPFTLQSPVGTLQGKIDILFKDAQSTWQLIDWKTEWASLKKVNEIAVQHQIQLAAYAQAVNKVIKDQPVTSLCFLNPSFQLYSINSSDLNKAWTQLSSF